MQQSTRRLHSTADRQSAARLELCRSCHPWWQQVAYDHVTPLIRDDLHWLRVPERITFKLCLFCLQGIARPGSSLHQVDVCTSLVVHGKIIAALTSRGHLIVPRTRLEFGKRAFAFAGPAAWNSLPDVVRSAESIDTFKRRLKSFLFSVSYPGLSFSVTACSASSSY